MKLIRLSLVLLALLPSLVFAQRVAPLENPDPIPVPASLSASEAKKVVVDSLFQRGWTITEEKDNNLVADLHVRDHWLQVDLSITREQVELSYRDSDNLNYGERRGTPVIHRSFRRWSDTLLSDVRTNMAHLEHSKRQ